MINNCNYKTTQNCFRFMFFFLLQRHGKMHVQNRFRIVILKKYVSSIAIQHYGGFIDSLCLYKYLSITKLFLNRNVLYEQTVILL